MKITRMASLAKDHRSITIINTTVDGEIARQHVMIGNAVYPLDGLPVLDGEELLTVLDVPMEKRMEYSVYMCDMWPDMLLITADNHQTDREASVIDTMVCPPWADVLCAYTQSGMVFMNADYRRVIEKEKDVSWWSRQTAGGATVLVAKKGYQSIATIMPEFGWATESVCEDLWNIDQAARDILEKRKAREARYEQQTMHTEEDTRLLPDVRALPSAVLPGDE